jgi:uncharacterized protein involved in exopolysaccharide biosynthesis
VNKGALIKRLYKKKWMIVLAGIIFAVPVYFYVSAIPPKYTSRATLFPLSNTSPVSASSALSDLLGGGNTGSSFSNDANLNILELAISRSVRENVASTRLPQFDNKTIAEILVNEANKHILLSGNKIQLPDDSAGAAVLGGELLYPDIMARMNKNSVLELNYTNTDAKLVTPISEVLINAISDFYINLRRQKALTDYQFISAKIDSLETTVAGVDSRAVSFQNTTSYIPNGKLQYQLPQQNLTIDKGRIESEVNLQINNRENALWTLQKSTPIVAVLDHPNPPFDISAPSAILYALFAFIAGLFLGAILVSWKLLFNFIKEELAKMMAA